MILLLRFLKRTSFALLILCTITPNSQALEDGAKNLRSNAQVEKTVRAYVEGLIKANIASLKAVTTTAQYRSLVDKSGRLNEDYDVLKGLGGVVGVDIISFKSYSNFDAYSVSIRHPDGRPPTEWSFRFDGPKVANAVPDRKTIQAAVRLPRSILDIVVSGDDRSIGKNEVEFLFATDRKPKQGATPLEFDGVRQSRLTYGAVSVRIPIIRRIGQINLPKTWKLFGYEIYREKQNDTKHFSLKRLSSLTSDDFTNLIRELGPKTALVFVHGFNTGFEDAVYRNAQIVWDLQYRGLAVLYSWSSKGGGVTDYGFDRESALFARDGFITLISQLHSELGIEKINVIAHSMGNMLVVDALKNNANSRNPVQLDQLVMAAPDVDRAVFSLAVPELHKIVKGMTLYASSADKALRASSRLAKFDRAGDVPSGGEPLILDHLDTIDVTAVGDEFLGLNHTEFATNRAVMNDIKILLEDAKRPPRLTEIRQIPEFPLPPSYWRYVE